MGAEDTDAAGRVSGARREDDDGRTVADMSMLDEPWHGRRSKPRAPDEGYTPAGFRERLRLISGALLAGLLVACVFIAAFALIILFCTDVWLR